MPRFARAIILVSIAALGAARHTAAMAADPSAMPPAPAGHDGTHDFDFNVGTWNTHIRRILNPLTGADQSMELNGTVTVKPIWHGKAQLEEIEADGSKGHWEGLSLFLYNPRSAQWSQTFIGAASGAFSGGLTGAFHDGRGVLIAQDTVAGRTIFVKGTWSEIKPNSHQYEESYSGDGGATWHRAFIADLTRAQPGDVVHKSPPLTGQDAQSGGFDYSFGAWQEHSRRQLHPLTRDTTWVGMQGSASVSKIWNGRASMIEYEGAGSSGPLELLALRVYNPAARQWSLNFATSVAGQLGAAPGIGEFSKGRIDFFDQELINGKQTLVRFSCWGIDQGRMQSEQAFSADEGKTWELNWVNEYIRVSQ